MIFAERLPVKTYTIADGLLRDGVSKVKQDSRGFLWFCTAEGVSRFDGYAFKNFRAEDGLPDRHANDFLETSGGVYLIATDKGVARLNPKGIAHSAEIPLFTVYYPEEKKEQKVNVLYEDRRGTVWVGTDGGLFRLLDAGGQLQLEKFSAESDPVVAIIEDRHGVLWAGLGVGNLTRIFPDGRVESYTTAEGLPNSLIVSMLETADGRIWAGLRPGEEDFGLLRFVTDPAPGKKVVERGFTLGDGLPTFWIQSLFQSSDGKIWIGTTKGLCLWQGENEKSVCRTYVSENDVCDREIYSITEDKDGNMWAGTGCGAKKFSRHGFTIFNKTDNLDTDVIRSVFENAAGEIFVSTVDKSLRISRFNDDSGGFVTVSPRFPEQLIYFGWGWNHWVWRDSTGAWWLPTGKGLFRSPPATDFESLASANLQLVETGASKNDIFRVFEDSGGDIWVTTVGVPGSELLRFERSTGIWHDETQRAGFSKETVGTAFAEDRSGNLWIATGSDAGDSRLIRFRDGVFRTFTERDGSPTGWTRDLYVDDAGRLWLANTANGLLMLDDADSEQLGFVRYAFSEGLSSGAVYCVTGDEFGRIYAGTGRGLNRLTPETGQVENFTTADGLPNSYIETAYRDRQNRLWFTTYNGLVLFQPEPVKPRKAPTVLITGLQAGGVAEPVSVLGERQIDDLKLSANENSVRIEFVGLGTTLGEKLSYEYRLGGEDSQWTPTVEHTVNFANLAPGDYRFEVRAASADKIYSPPAAVYFNITAPVWRQWWFMALAAALLALIAYLIYRNRVARLLEIERTRTRIATDLHDDIGTNLSKISLLSEIVSLQLTDANIKNKQMLASIAEISRESVTSMSDIVWTINPNRDSMHDLTSRMVNYVEGLFHEREDIDVHFHIPGENKQVRIPMDIRRDLYLIFKEAIGNAARHSNCKNMDIDFRLEGSWILLNISDDGRGFDLSENSDGNGLINMKRRAEANGGSFSIESQKGEGTKIQIRFPQR